MLRGEREGFLQLELEVESEAILDTIDRLGLDPSLGVLLSIMVTAMLFKGVLMLLSKRQVGYAVAQVATDLRLSLLNALMRTRWSRV